MGRLESVPAGWLAEQEAQPRVQIFPHLLHWGGGEFPFVFVLPCNPNVVLL